MRWKLKGLIQKTLGSLPHGQSLNDQLQRRFGGLSQPESEIAGKLEDLRLSLRYLRDCEFSLSGKTLLEIGAGWYPTLPICFSLTGARRIVTYDLVRHIDSQLAFRMVRALEPHLDSIAEASGTPIEAVRVGYNALLRAKTLGNLLETARVDYRAPADARRTDLAPESVDLVYSNSVMEHVPKEAILELMIESARILRPGGLALHNVACNDHYAHVDRGISFVNYLQYDESQWSKWNNSLQYQNRLRAPEFLDLATQGGLDVIYKQTHVATGSLEALAGFRVAAQFQRFSTEDLATTTVDFVARKPRAEGSRA